MTEDTSPENLRKFLESDDPAMVRMGLSMAKSLKLSDDIIGIIVGLKLWNQDSSIRKKSSNIIDEKATSNIKRKVAKWKNTSRLTKVAKNTSSGKKIQKICSDLIELNMPDAQPINLLVKIFRYKHTIRDVNGKLLYYDELRHSWRDSEGRPPEILTDEKGYAILGGPSDYQDRAQERYAAAELLAKINDERTLNLLINSLNDELLRDCVIDVLCNPRKKQIDWKSKNIDKIKVIKALKEARKRLDTSWRNSGGKERAEKILRYIEKIENTK